MRVRARAMRYFLQVSIIVGNLIRRPTGTRRSSAEQEIEGAPHPRALRLPAGEARREMRAPGQDDRANVSAVLPQCLLHLDRLDFEMRKVVLAIGDEKRRQAALNVKQRTRGAV